MFLGRKIFGNWASLGKKISNDFTGLGRKANVGLRMVSNTANEVGDSLGKASNVLEKASSFNPALKIVAEGLNTLKAGTGVVSGLSNTGRSAISGSTSGVLNGLSQTADSGSKFATGVVKTGLPVMIL
jgi:hypothetical protein